MNILEMNREQLSSLDPASVFWPLTTEEFLHMAKTFGAFWSYDYKAADQGRVGKHAKLKSKNEKGEEYHSDKFFVSKILLELENIKQILAHQMVDRLKEAGIGQPQYLGGVPDGAIKLGEAVAKILGLDLLEMKKIDGRIRPVTPVPRGATALLIEDVCTRGTGFKEAMGALSQAYPGGRYIRVDAVIANRRGLKWLTVDGMGGFRVLPIVELEAQDWDPDECPLCKMGSVAIKPKVSPEAWADITSSQL